MPDYLGGEYQGEQEKEAARDLHASEKLLAREIYGAIQDASNFSERSQQADAFQIGVSDIGWCSERTRRMVAGIPEPITDKLPAFIGIALGDHIEKACKAMWPDAIIQAEVSVTLVGDQGTYVVTGHPDLIKDNMLLDFKTDRGLATVRRTGPSQQQQIQRHTYAKGAHEAGLFGDIPLTEVLVGNVWMDRAADEKELHVDLEPYDPMWIEVAAAWVDDVVYAYINGHEARKEPPREMCAVVCGHYLDCRALDTDVTGLLTDNTVLTAVEMYREGLDLAKRGGQLKDQAKAHLVGIQGSTGKFAVRWTTVSGGRVEYDRTSYQKLDIKEIR